LPPGYRRRWRLINQTATLGIQPDPYPPSIHIFLGLRLFKMDPPRKEIHQMMAQPSLISISIKRLIKWATCM
jgi:hypothetical protein